MPNKIKKLVIPVAGYGTRFLPATKAQPKEMLPILDKPIIQYVVEEAVASGIEDVILVTNLNKRAVEDHFDRFPELETWLTKQGKTKDLEQVKNIAELANFIYIRQRGPYGNGTPVLCAKHVIGNEPFAVIWGDEPFFGEIPRLKQLIEVYQQYDSPVLTGYEVNDEGTKKYAILKTKPVNNNIFEVEQIVEKPGPQKAPSRLASLGGFILTPDIFEILENAKPGQGGEIWLVDAIAKLKEKRKIYACQVKGDYYDVGSKLGWLEANVTFGLQHPELGSDFKKFLNSIL
jgi:UTP--glucose-1-phosphate uridylyltransferase